MLWVPAFAGTNGKGLRLDRSFAGDERIEYTAQAPLPFIPAQAGIQPIILEPGSPLEFTPAKAGAGKSGERA